MKNQNSDKWKTAVPGLITFVLLITILIYPMESYQSALSGLKIFLQSVFPALLPFFIVSGGFFIRAAKSDYEASLSLSWKQLIYLGNEYDIRLSNRCQVNRHVSQTKKDNRL